MNVIKQIFLFLLIFIFDGCGSGSSNTSIDNLNSSKDVTSILVDSKISGVSYSCGNNKGVTNLNGEFTCKENTIVTFNIGGITLGSTKISPDSKFITPATLYNLDITNIDDTKIFNFIQLLQSLDNDNNATNGIEITQSIRTQFDNYLLDLNNANITQTDISNAVSFVSKNLISKNQALEHYVDTLTDTLKITFKNEPYYYQQWYLDYNETFYRINNIDINAHINIGDSLQLYTGKGIKIAIIDDGLDINHEDLGNAIIHTYDINSNSSNVFHSSLDSYHGTAVTGIIGARKNNKGMQGIASNANIIFLKYNNNMSDSETIALFNKAEEFGADVINCSWGTYDVSEAVKEKIQDVAINGRNGKGTVIVFASGNNNNDMGNDESAIPEVIAVGGTDENNLRATYSNYGEYLDVVAPSGYYTGIMTLDPMNDDGISTIDKNYLLSTDINGFIGTSASAPIVTASIALLLEKNPNLTRIEIENILKNSSDKIGALAYYEMRNNYYGYGKLNLTKLLSLNTNH
jgi:subtilisin family serine protease